LSTIAQGDPEQRTQTQQLVHSLKGVAGNIGITNLANLSTEIDLALKRGEAISEQQVSLFAQTLKNTENEIRAYLGSVACDKVAQTQLSKHASIDFKYSLMDLLQRVQQNEFIDEDELNELSRIVPNHLDSDWQAITEALGVFDYETSYVKLQSLLSYQS